MKQERRIALVAFSFGGRKDTVGPSNTALARVALRFKRENPAALIIMQWEVADPLFSDSPHLTIRRRGDGKYLTSEDIASQAIKFMKFKNSIAKWEIHVLAHPFLHRFKCMRLFPGFTVKAVPTGKVPFDKKSMYWWCRGPVRLLAYALLQMLFGRYGR